jgi:hypothetical protein
VKLYDCFRPGDIVRAKVTSLGDARTYYLSTAENELGVVYAKSMAGRGADGALLRLKGVSIVQYQAYRRSARAAFLLLLVFLLLAILFRCFFCPC